MHTIKLQNEQQVDQASKVITSGYSHVGYAESLAEFGNPRQLPRCGGWILERQIQGFSDHDAMGCYPLFACQNWSQLHLDLEEIGNDLVSLSLVTDPFGNYDPAYLHHCFEDVVRPFKHHFVIDLSRPMDTFVSSNHRRNTRKAFKHVEVERCHEPIELLTEWIGLYDNLIKRHNIKGIPAFSRLAFAKQLIVPGIVMFRIIHKETTIGIVLWYIKDEICYYHLAAYDEISYRLGASFALFWYAIEYFADNGFRWINLGAGAGIESNGTDGLSRFKRGWSTGSRISHFCGRIFDPVRYLEIVQSKGTIATDYFPAYRVGEFTSKTHNRFS